MGKYMSGKLVGRDGVTVFEDHNEFGQEWQVTDKDPQLFQAMDVAPQYPEKCILPDPASRDQVRLGSSVARQAAKKACDQSEHHFYKDHIEACIFDVMASGDVDIARAG
ncbi:expressed unknown protein [Seminavis robusta]|uniref:Uncharacterized protein n=1 Tax=Seminavis robusta TaxID=568900 RepID=A0A9N8HTF9_9STRA|nr:expressed unknown protein [Seminavis robusta]|eukprot:Sro1508_g278460.1 n/a (109) ;mRNA; f:21748-22179